MPAVASRQASGQDQDPSVKSLDYILALPLTQLRIWLGSMYRSANPAFGGKELEYILSALEKLAANDPKESLADFHLEIQNATEAMQTGIALSDPNLDSPLRQLLWASCLTFLTCHPELMEHWQGAKQKPAKKKGQGQKKEQENPYLPLVKSTVWKQLTEGLRASFELSMHAVPLAEGLRNEPVELHWGGPGSGYHYVSSEGVIVLDFISSLIGGFEHSRSEIMTQVGMSLISALFTPQMMQLYMGMMQLEAKAHPDPHNPRVKGQLSQDEYKQLHLMRAEWEMRLRLFVTAESNPARRYTASPDHDLAQDYGASLNYFLTLMGGIGEIVLSGAKAADIFPEDNPQAAFMHLLHAITLSFFRNNELFHNTMQEWRQLGVEPENITAEPKQQGGKPPTPREAFAELLEMVGGRKGLENLLPPLYYHIYRDKEPQTDAIEKFSRQRGVIIDEIWDRYLKQHAQEMLQEMEQQMDQNMDNSDQMREMMENSEFMQPGEGGVDVEGAGEMPDIDQPSETPQEQRDKEGQGKTGEGDEGKSLEELIKELLKKAQQGEEGQEAEGQAQGEGQEGEGKEPGDMFAQAAGFSQTMEKIARGDWRDYMERVRELAFAIRLVGKALSRLQKRQSQIVTVVSPTEHEIIPPNNELSRYDQDAVESLREKIATGQKITVDDLAFFRADEDKIINALIDIVIMIDGSGSMHGDPMVAAVQAGISLFEAARKQGQNVYVSMWGDANPLRIAEPGMTHREIGERIEDVRKGKNWGTSLRPGIVDMLKTLAGQKNPPHMPIGHSHFVIVSDGDIFDIEDTKKLLTEVFRSNPYVTFDFLIINEQTNTKMDELANWVKKQYPAKNVGVEHVNSASEVLVGLLRLITDRTINIPANFMAVSHATKQSGFRQVLNRIQEGLSR